MDIQAFNRYSIQQWNGGAPFAANHFQTIPEYKKRQSERTMDRIGMQIRKSAKQQEKSSALKTEPDFKMLFLIVFTEVLGFSKKEATILSNHGFMPSTKRFMQMARKFDAEIEGADIFQAARNLWIANTLQLLFGNKVEVTNALFAYSMLYPYTDNYLDSVEVSSSDKVLFSKRFRDRLEGKKVLSENRHEQKIYDLLSLIEAEFDRKQFPDVYKSLLAIHDAQTKGLRLMGSGDLLGENELLHICVEKGGTSVLADGMLINGSLNQKQKQFCYDFGVLLQMVDDIQDLEEDRGGNLETYFVRQAKVGRLEEKFLKILSFTENVIREMVSFNSELANTLSTLMAKSIHLILIESVGENLNHFSPMLAGQLEQAYPFRFAYLTKQKQAVKSKRVFIFEQIEKKLFSTKPGVNV